MIRIPREIPSWEPIHKESYERGSIIASGASKWDNGGLLSYREWILRGRENEGGRRELFLELMNAIDDHDYVLAISHGVGFHILVMNTSDSRSRRNAVIRERVIQQREQSALLPSIT